MAMRRGITLPRPFESCSEGAGLHEGRGDPDDGAFFMDAVALALLRPGGANRAGARLAGPAFAAGTERRATAGEVAFRRAGDMAVDAAFAAFGAAATTLDSAGVGRAALLRGVEGAGGESVSSIRCSARRTTRGRDSDAKTATSTAATRHTANEDAPMIAAMICSRFGAERVVHREEGTVRPAAAALCGRAVAIGPVVQSDAHEGARDGGIVFWTVRTGPAGRLRAPRSPAPKAGPTKREGRRSSALCVAT